MKSPVGKHVEREVTAGVKVRYPHHLENKTDWTTREIVSARWVL
ncbi:hypothetical protein [Paraburkholderia xenovorans]|nr:hypothetical protein [Paraburkholderia xenovorans]